jgi:hypothetical protein
MVIIRRQFFARAATNRTVAGFRSANEGSVRRIGEQDPRRLDDRIWI